jgi:hypothetical protein
MGDNIRPSYREGFKQLFYFFYSIIRDEDSPDMVREFLRQVNRDDLVRRRERTVARAQHLVPSSVSLWKGLRRIDMIERRLRSTLFDESQPRAR